MTVVTQADSATMDPLITYVHSTVDATRAQAIFDLLAYTDDEGTVVPRIAESIEPNADNTVWTIKIRPGVEFSDGTPYDAAAVKFNIDRDADPVNRSTQYLVAKDLVATVVDDLTLEISLKASNAQFDRVIAQSFSLVPSPTAVKKLGDEFGQKPVGAGPFTLEKWVAGSHMSLVKNPNYWNKGYPKLDELTFKVVPDPTQQINAVAGGEAQAVIGQQTDTLTRGKKAGLNAVATRVGGGATMYLNNRRAPFNDVRARRALQLAFDMADLTRTVYGETTDPVTSLFPSTSPLHDAEYSLPKQDKVAAQSLFDEIAADGQELRFTYLVTANPRNAKLAQYMQGKLSEYEHVSMEIETTADGEWASRYRSGEFESTFGSGWFVSPYPVLNSVLGAGAPLNYSGYSSKSMDDALAATDNASSEDDLADAYRRVQEIYLEDVPYLYTASTTMSVLSSKDVVGIEPFQLGASFLVDQVGYSK